MKRIGIRLTAKFVASIAVAILCVSPTFGQRSGGGMGGMGGMSGMGGGMGGMGMGMGMMEPSPLEKLKDSLRSAKDEASQKKILGKIQSMLSTQYDSYLRDNEYELQEMEKSVKALRAQLERRKSAKGQLLNLELQRIANEASGLVWPEDQGGQRMDVDMGGLGGGMGPGAMGDDMGYEAENRPAITTDSDGDAISVTDTKTQNQLRQIVLAALNFESANAHFPGNIRDEEGKTMLSWRVAILPYIEEQALYSKFKLDEPWNSEHNVELLEEMPDSYKHVDFDSETKTVYLGFDGKGTMFESGKELGFGDITDGSSNTISMAQMNRQSAVPWTKPADVKFTPGTPVTQLAESKEGEGIVALGDGSVARIQLGKLESETLEHLIQRNDGNTVRIEE